MISIDAAGLSYDECLALGFPREVVNGAIWTLNMAIGMGLGALTVTKVSEILLESGNQNATNERFVQMVNYLVRICEGYRACGCISVGIWEKESA